MSFTPSASSLADPSERTSEQDLPGHQGLQGHQGLHRHQGLQGIDGFGSRPAWMVFEYTLPAADRSLRAIVWRLLRSMHALNLKQGAWAVALGEGQLERLRSLAGRITAAAGTASMVEVGYERPAERELQSRLNRACERVWDGFFNEADFFPAPGEPTSDARGAAEEVFDRLQTLFAEGMVKDIVQSDASWVASTRLDELGERLLDGQHDERLDAEKRCRVEMAVQWQLCNGLTRNVAVLSPIPALAWNRAFRRFEETMYLPRADRVELRHGTFTWVDATDDGAEMMRALEERVGRFQRSWA